MLTLSASVLADAPVRAAGSASARSRTAAGAKAKSSRRAPKPALRRTRSAVLTSRSPRATQLLPLRATAGGRLQAPARLKKRPRYAPVEVFHINRRDSMQLRIADNRGRPIRNAQKTFDHFFRCHHTNKKGRMDPRLMRLIYQVGRHYDGRRVEVVSGYRDPSVAKNPKSPHKQGAACDFRIKGVANSELRDYLRKNFEHVGVGYYPNSSFVHLDVRAGASAFWIDYSEPGKNSLYSDNPVADLKTGRAETFKPKAIDPSWVNEPGGGDGDADGCCEESAAEGTARGPQAPSTVGVP